VQLVQLALILTDHGAATQNIGGLLRYQAAYRMRVCAGRKRRDDLNCVLLGALHTLDCYSINSSYRVTGGLVTIFI
jgi:hypothetical protein